MNTCDKSCGETAVTAFPAELACSCPVCHRDFSGQMSTQVENVAKDHQIGICKTPWYVECLMYDSQTKNEA
jgi:hypothetical protein